MSSHEVASGVHTAQADQILAAAEPPRERYVPPVVADTKEGDTGRLVEFLQDRDAPCPLCGYNLRNLTDNVCPECRHELRLTVGVTKPMFLWFLLAMTPCTFAGIAAGLTLIPVIVQWLGGAGPPPAILVTLVLLGLASAVGGLMLIRHRFAFLRQEPRRQRRLAVAVLMIHGLALLAWFVTFLILEGGP